MPRKYSRPFLKEIIAKLDFALPFKDIKNEVHPELNKMILSFYPISEPQVVLAQELTLGPEKLEHKSEEITELHFHGRNREKSLKLTNDFLVFSYKKYDSFAIIKDEFLKICKSLFDNTPKLQIKRFGLRYINLIELTEHTEPTKWDSYINENLLGIFKFYDDQKVISRAFQNLEFNFGEMNLRFQYGMHNPDYPATILKKMFILDFDAYFNGLIQSIPELEASLDSYHDKIEEMFESSIKDELREIMDEQK